MRENTIKVGFCVAYDWRFLSMSLPQVYDHADVICLSIDGERRSWSDKPFQWDEAGFQKLLRAVDREGKIILYEDNFHLPSETPAGNEVRQRAMMAKKMGPGGWHIQLDCDEYFLDFAGFVRYLRRLPAYTFPFNVCCPLVTLFKKVQDGFLYVHPGSEKNLEFIQIASRTPAFGSGRRNSFFNFHCNFNIIHQSYARSEAEIFQKLDNWGHTNDFDVDVFFRFWQSLDSGNYSEAKDFHPMHPEQWPSLKMIVCEDEKSLVSQFRKADLVSLSPMSRFLKNSRWVSRFRSGLRSFNKR